MRTITPQIRKLLSRMNPDRLTDVPGSHSFIYHPKTGLLVDPDAQRAHTKWGHEDPVVGRMLEHESYNDMLTGRYVDSYWNIGPVVAFWAFANNDRFMQPCSRALLEFLPADTLAVTDMGVNKYSEPIHLASLAKTGASPTRVRGHRYWQLRQTSESLIRESLPGHQTLDPDLTELVERLTPDTLLFMNTPPLGLLYTEEGQLIEFPDGGGGHSRYVENHPEDFAHYDDEWHNHCVAARFVPMEINNYHSKYHGQTLNILSVWAYKRENAPILAMLPRALRAMAARLPADTIATTGAGRYGAFEPFRLASMSGGPTPRRGWQYWQLRQTSESRL